MIFSANFDCGKVNPLIFVKFWWQACLPTLLYGSELFKLTPSLLQKLERCQLWFIRNIFYVHKFTPKQLLLKLSGLNSIESEIAIKKMLFLGPGGHTSISLTGKLVREQISTTQKSRMPQNSNPKE